MRATTGMPSGLSRTLRCGPSVWPSRADALDLRSKDYFGLGRHADATAAANAAIDDLGVGAAVVRPSVGARADELLEALLADFLSIDSDVTQITGRSAGRVRGRGPKASSR
jgi:7-keto-8-aminopelargonate synthetase-like enzyme